MVRYRGDRQREKSRESEEIATEKRELHEFKQISKKVQNFANVQEISNPKNMHFLMQKLRKDLVKSTSISFSKNQVTFQSKKKFYMYILNPLQNFDLILFIYYMYINK